MICVELPKSAVKDVEVLIGEILSHFVDVFLCADKVQCFEEVGVFEVPVSDLPIIIGVKTVKDSHDDCVGVSLLELGSLLQEF